MSSEISDKLDALAVSVQETKDEGRLLKLTDENGQLKIRLKGISLKM